MDLLFLAVGILDGLIVGAFLFYLCEAIFGDKPFARLLKLVASVVGGVGYSVWVLSAGMSDEGSMLGFSILTFGPIVIALILSIIGYMFKKKQ